MAREDKSHDYPDGNSGEPRADQPHPQMDQCMDVPEGLPVPIVPTPEPCDECPPSDCYCQPGSSMPSNCIEDLIATQAKEIAAAEKAKAFKAALEGLLSKAEAARKEYTQDTFERLSKTWSELDAEIAKLLHNLACGVPCWRCVIECHICNRLEDLRIAEQWLYAEGSPYVHANNLYDLQYWLAREKEKKERSFNRVTSVLAAWESPAKAIDKILNDNAKLIADANRALGSAPGSVIFDIFLRLVPMHLAIAPVRGLNWADPNAAWKTKIAKKYTDFCTCDTGAQDYCCGVYLGEPGWRQRLLGWQPYLIDPADLIKLICCIVEQRYGPAKNALAQIDADLTAVTDKIASYKGKLANASKSLEADAKAAIPSEVKCHKYERPETESTAE